LWQQPRGWDLVCAAAVPGDRNRSDPVDLDLARRNRQPLPGVRGEPVTDVLPSPVMPSIQRADQPPPGEVVQHVEDVLRDRVPEVSGPTAQDLVDPGQHIPQVLL